MNLIKSGTTSKLDCVYITNLSTGAPITGATYTGVTISYFLSTGTAVTHASAVTMTLGTWVTLGFKEVDSTNFPGIYQVGVPNGVFATASTFGFLSITGIASQAPCVVKYEVTGSDINDAVRLGLTALPNVAIGTTGQIATGNASGVPLGVAGNVTGSVASVTGAVASVTGAVGSVTGAVGSVTAAVTTSTTSNTAIATAVAAPSASTIATATAAAVLITPAHLLATDASGYVTTTGGGGGGPTLSEITAALLDNPSVPLQTDGSGHVNAAVVLGAVASVAGNIGGSLAGVVGGVVNAVTIDLTQAVPRTNTAETVGDALHASRANGAGSFVVDSTALTATLYESDGSTAAVRFSIDTAGAPTRRSAL